MKHLLILSLVLTSFSAWSFFDFFESNNIQVQDQQVQEQMSTVVEEEDGVEFYEPVIVNTAAGDVIELQSNSRMKMAADLINDYNICTSYVHIDDNFEQFKTAVIRSNEEANLQLAANAEDAMRGVFALYDADSNGILDHGEVALLKGKKKKDKKDDVNEAKTCGSCKAETLPGGDTSRTQYSCPAKCHCHGGTICYKDGDLAG